MRDTELVNTALASTHCMKKSSISARSTAFRAVVALTALVSFCSFKSFRSRDRTRFFRASSRREEIPPPWYSWAFCLQMVEEEVETLMNSVSTFVKLHSRRSGNARSIGKASIYIVCGQFNVRVLHDAVQFL